MSPNFTFPSEPQVHLLLLYPRGWALQSPAFSATCAHAHVRKCGWFVPSWFLSFSVFVCMFVCETGGGLLGSMRG